MFIDKSFTNASRNPEELGSKNPRILMVSEIGHRPIFLAGAIALLALAALPAAADVFNIGAAVNHTWDNNFARSADIDSEQITQESAFISLNKAYSKQRFVARVSGSHYEYQERTDLDADFVEGNATWQSQWSDLFKTDVQFLRNAYPVDRLESFEKDVVSRNDATVKAMLGTGSRLSFAGGARQTKQEHSNDLRASIDFDEDEAFLEASYLTGNKSSLTLRVKDGERTYPNQLILTEPRDLDFEYQQAELEATWAASTKTNVTANFGYFSRDGATNEGVGTVATLDADWKATDKVTFTAGLRLSQPAVGETSDSPEEVRGGFVTFGWQFTPKLNIGMAARAAEQDYLARDEEPERTERIYSATPLMISYRFSQSITLRLDSTWVERESPLFYRDFSYTQGSLGLAVVF